ncbi:nitroreductase family protein [Pseudomonas oryzihabitans]|uniref:nitroreductase family protein n=1 Tax=Pseudomonas oryzihabitans TaxID=47885 RepID=UPI002895420B|nr:nitroreductase family protein [Pseudomonas oryzihabitans]MDT3720942.1 nitroreductase family protein [Pseudomonas oryzihabitans]
MDALEALCNRASVGRLTEPGPSVEQLELLLRAADRAPDHKLLRPWRLILVSGEGRERLGELYAEALLRREPGTDTAALDKARRMPLRAPLVIAVVASPQEHPKVPLQEQVITAGCVAHGLVNAAFALGLGAVWRSGEFSYDPWVLRGLGLAAEEQLVGYIYLGTPEVAPRVPVPRDLGQQVSHWPAPAVAAG